VLKFSVSQGDTEAMNAAKDRHCWSRGRDEQEKHLSQTGNPGGPISPSGIRHDDL
jgi:hypothetical protein